MATVVLQYAGLAAGTFIGGPIGGMIGRAVGAVAGNIIDQALFGPGTRRVQGPRLNDLRIMSSSEGAAIPRLWGRIRVSGQVIWATNFDEVASTSTAGSSSKGGGGGETRVTEYSYYASFAIALCEGEIDRIGRVWADGKDFDISEVTVRLYRGTETQEPDSLIVAKEGPDNAPAYRGLAYIVFERLPVNAFGNRLPQLSFEVFRSAGGSENHVRAVNIIPGSTEFGYDTAIVTRETAPGVTEVENAHASGLRSDWSVSLDQLGGTCRNLKAASLVVAWFGTDLRCGRCEVKPGVETGVKDTSPEAWSVNGIARADAHAVSMAGHGPAFGGTPSDASVMRALQDLRGRGMKTVFYPFILMDVPPGNGLPDPFGGAEQAAYPWRGRITAEMAPGLPGSPDGTASAAAEIAAFAGTAAPEDLVAGGSGVTYSGPPEWSYRRMVLHYARLCALAGGVDAFLIGSELRGLTTLRGPGGSFPFVDVLVALADEVKAILPDADVSYAADWSEYFGYHPADGSGDVFFHLDPLWSSPAVSFVGIDNYMPLSDWRDGRQHTDHLAGWASIYDAGYLKSNIAGGEGFDWFYATDADREMQARTAITDGAHGKPWVFRYKDLVSWWSNPHVNRIAGIEAGMQTGWVPQSKPFWFTEAGCPAVDKGSNQPNAFVDAKSSENLLPHFSRGTRDDMIQSRYIAAVSEYWSAAGGGNPVSSLYGGPMVDPDRIFFWAWDARPYPHFPALEQVWADGVNHALGHWLNGRVGAVPLARLIASVCGAYGVDEVDVAELEGLVDGFAIDRPMTARDALEGLIAAYAIDVIDSGHTLRFAMRGRARTEAVTADMLVETDAERPLHELTRVQEMELPAALRLSYVESGLDYRAAAVEAKRTGGSSLRDIRLDLPCAVDQAQAQIRADVALAEIWSAREQASFVLPPSLVRLEAGDVVELPVASGPVAIRIDEVTDGAARRMRGRRFDPVIFDAPEAPLRHVSAGTARVFGRPDVVFLDLPLTVNTAEPYNPWIAASAKPWPGRLGVHRKSGPASFSFNRTIERQATKGVLVDGFAGGPADVFDRASSLLVRLDYGALSAVSDEELLQGANAAAVGSAATGWEIIQFGQAELVGSNIYRLTHLLRGQSGSEPEIRALRPAGERFVLLNAAVVQPVLTFAEAGLPSVWHIGPAQYDAGRAHVSVPHQATLVGLRPLSPCQLRAWRAGGDVMFGWIRRTRIDGDSWDAVEVALGEADERYAVEILDGDGVRRSVTAGMPLFRYGAAEIAADFGADPGVFTIRICQLSATYGRGAHLLRTIHV